MKAKTITLSNSEWQVMEKLWDHAPQTVMELVHVLAPDTGWSKSTIVTMVGRLESKGAICYTRGQRKGLGLAMGAPVYVCSKDMQANTVTVGPNEALFSHTLIAENWNWLPFPALTEPLRVTAKARYRHIPCPATVYPMEDGHAKVVFDEPQRAITPGQAVVLYDGDMVIGAGTISQVE